MLPRSVQSDWTVWGVLRMHSRPALWGEPTHPTPHQDLSGPEAGAGEGKPTPEGEEGVTLGKHTTKA